MEWPCSLVAPLVPGSASHVTTDRIGTRNAVVNSMVWPPRPCPRPASPPPGSSGGSSTSPGHTEPEPSASFRPPTSRNQPAQGFNPLHANILAVPGRIAKRDCVLPLLELDNRSPVGQVLPPDHRGGSHPAEDIPVRGGCRARRGGGGTTDHNLAAPAILEGVARQASSRGTMTALPRCQQGRGSDRAEHCGRVPVDSSNENPARRSHFMTHLIISHSRVTARPRPATGRRFGLPPSVKSSGSATEGAPNAQAY